MEGEGYGGSERKRKGGMEKWKGRFISQEW